MVGEFIFGGEKVNKKNTTKNTKNDPPAPYPPAAFPPIFMGRAAVPPTNGAADPYGHAG